ncbi:hypothetical protein [Leisingera sp.]|uniref:hypothetical protein n=1 Tax=Leisingera sp. TaxID=1879318 RepID=UPI002B2659EB|nr:hypothetical protein [Leisingera sp.]
MTIIKMNQLPASSDFRSLYEGTALGAGFLLTVEDRLGIERLLHSRGTRNAPSPALLNGLLSHKLGISRGAPWPTPPELVVAGCHVTYMISGGGARSGVLSMSPAPAPGRILVASLLGATLVGMRKMQKVPLLRDDGRIETIVVLDVFPAPNHDAA